MKKGLIYQVECPYCGNKFDVLWRKVMKDAGRNKRLIYCDVDDPSIAEPCGEGFVLSSYLKVQWHATKMDKEYTLNQSSSGIVRNVGN